MAGVIAWDYFKDPEADPIQRFLNGSEWTREHRRRLALSGRLPARPVTSEREVRRRVDRHQLLRNLQDRFDVNGDGRIDVEEISAVRRGVPYAPPTRPRPAPRSAMPSSWTAPRSPAPKGHVPPPPPPPHPPRFAAHHASVGHGRPTADLRELFARTRRSHAELMAAMETGDPRRIARAREALEGARLRLAQARRAALGT